MNAVGLAVFGEDFEFGFAHSEVPLGQGVVGYLLLLMYSTMLQMVVTPLMMSGSGSIVILLWLGVVVLFFADDVVDDWGGEDGDVGQDEADVEVCFDVGHVSSSVQLLAMSLMFLTIVVAAAIPPRMGSNGIIVILLC